MKLCIIDVLGLTYDGTTLTKRGLGGSESAVILMSKELSKLGFDVTVYNDCESDDSKPGIYDGVRFRPLREAEQTEYYDIMISSRSVAPFAPQEIRNQFKTFSYMPNFDGLMANSRLRVLWLHDTFCDGDNLIEDFLLQGRINELFTLSDFHTNYITNADHGKHRVFETIKPYIFQTRNGINKWVDWVDVREKDPNLFVYNASYTKGMEPLVNDIWPKVIQHLPQAKLKVIGGFYRFREDQGPDEQEKSWRAMKERCGDTIDFTGVISQKEISDILTKASYMIYPCAFPETFGISTLEAIYHNTPIITCRFGALEETAIDDVSYKIPYPVEPNFMVPWLNRDMQIEYFTQSVIAAYNNPYLHQQKMYACNKVKDICGWDSVAKQWKQHFFKKLGAFLPVGEYREVTKINHRVREVFGRRFFNAEELQEPRQEQQYISVVTTTYNAENYIASCILSVAQQDYNNYQMIIVDDASTDNTHDVAWKTIDSLPLDLQGKFIVIRNKENVGAVKNQYDAIVNHCDSPDIVMILDGDDWLINDPNIFHKYNNIYHDGAQVTYGSCWSLVDNIPLIAQPYPPQIKEAKAYRDYKFNWNMPYTHLRTFIQSYFWERFYANTDELKDQDGNWLRAGGDTAIFYGVLEQADPDKVVCVPDIVMNYNDTNPLNDYKVNGEEQTRNANYVLSKKKKQKISVVIPTMWRCQDLFAKALKNYVDNDLIDDIIIIDNDQSRSGSHPIAPGNICSILGVASEKIKIATMGENIGVNPAWNLGAGLAKNELICFANDDIDVDPAVFQKVMDEMSVKPGVYGIIWGDPKLNQPASTDYSIDFIDWEPGDIIHCFGQFFFVKKENWIDIDPNLIINWGDDWIIHNHLMKNLRVAMIHNIKFETTPSQTVNDHTVTLVSPERFIQERDYFLQWADRHPYVYGTPQKIEVQHQEAPKVKKKILIAIPTARYIEPDTFKSIYDQEIPDGYEADFQFFYGYQVDQVRNLIAHWVVNGWDYLFSVDSDMSFAPDTLRKLLSHDKDMVSGIYRQRNEQQHIEIYDLNLQRAPYGSIEGQGLTQIGGCGFGCVLIKKEVFLSVGYPYFEYHSAIDHAQTFSEDVDFCKKALDRGFKIWVDPSILCGHIGTKVFNVVSEKPQLPIPPKIEQDHLKTPTIQHFNVSPQVPKPGTIKVAGNPVMDRFRELASFKLLPQDHINYLVKLRSEGFNPKVIYDIGSCVLHWTGVAKEIWPDSEFILFEGMKAVEPLYKERGFTKYNLGVLSSVDNNPIKFYENLEHPGGNSVYRENEEFSPAAAYLFPEDKGVVQYSRTLDSVVLDNEFPLPDLIKIDIQGSELDVLKGAKQVLQNCHDIILEMQYVDYNAGAPKITEVSAYLESLGFENISGMFCGNNIDGDFHFRRP